MTDTKKIRRRRENKNQVIQQANFLGRLNLYKKVLISNKSIVLINIITGDSFVADGPTTIAKFLTRELKKNYMAIFFMIQNFIAKKQISIGDWIVKRFEDLTPEQKLQVVEIAELI